MYLWAALISFHVDWIEPVVLVFTEPLTCDSPGSLSSGTSDFQSWDPITCTSGLLGFWGLPGPEQRAGSKRAQAQCQPVFVLAGL